MPKTDTVLTAAGVVLAGVLVARVFGDDARAEVRDLRFSIDALPTPDGEDQFIEPGTDLIDSGGGFGGGYRSRIESALKGDSVGL
jgi:hypothetical protein